LRNSTEIEQQVTLEEFLQLISEDKALRKQTEDLRKLRETDTEEYKKRKKQQAKLFIPGAWETRSTARARLPILLFDIDGGDEGTFVFHLEELKKDPHVFLVTQSTGGGAHVWFWADAEAEKEVQEHLSKLLQLPICPASEAEEAGFIEFIDNSPRNGSTVWFAAHTPPNMLHVNWDSKPWPAPQAPAKPKPQQKTAKQDSRKGGYKHKFTVQEKVDDIIRQITQAGRDITGDFRTWRGKIILPLIAEFGEAGREMVHEVSSHWSNGTKMYSRKETDEEVDRTLGNLSKFPGVDINHFLAYAEEKGIRYDVQAILSARSGNAGAKVSSPAKEEAPAAEGGKRSKDVNEKSLAQDNLEKFLAEKYDFRFNEITRMPELREKGAGEWVRMDDYRLNSIVRAAKRKGLKAASKARVAETIESDFARLANPIQEYFKELDLSDAHDYIGDLVATVTPVTDADMFRKYFEKWLVAAVANVFILDRCANHQCFILTGKQGAYKSTWIRNLCPPALTEYYFEGNLDPENKDDLFATTANLLYNMDDYFASITAKKIDQFKGFLTKNIVNARPPYGRYPINLPKICSFIASSNETQFLHDHTGSRRFLPFEVSAIDIEAAQAIDIDNVWAQAYSLYLEGFEYWHTREDQVELQQHNEQYEVQTLEYELFTSYFSRPETEEEATAFLTTPGIYTRIVNREPGVRLSIKKLGEAINRAGFERVQRRRPKEDGGPKVRQWGYLVITRSDYERADDETPKTAGEGDSDFLRDL